MKVALIRYNAGNIQSVIYALQRLGIDPLLTDNHHEIQTADKVIFPGVGEASSAMKSVRSKGLDKVIPALKQPVLGVCVGLQLLCRHSEENDTPCLGVFENRVKKFPSAGFKVPQMGWNNIYDLQGALFKGMAENEFVYFVHSFYAELGDTTAAKADYALPFSASLCRDNFYAVQFHPEKSSTAGAKVLQNFLEV